MIPTTGRPHGEFPQEEGHPPGPHDPADVATPSGPADRIAVLDQRGRLLRAALGFAGCSLPSYDRAPWALRTWLDPWSGIGRVAVGMHRQGFDLQVPRMPTTTTHAAIPECPLRSKSSQ